MVWHLDSRLPWPHEQSTHTISVKLQSIFIVPYREIEPIIKSPDSSRDTSIPDPRCYGKIARCRGSKVSQRVTQYKKSILELQGQRNTTGDYFSSVCWCMCGHSVCKVNRHVIATLRTALKAGQVMRDTLGLLKSCTVMCRPSGCWFCRVIQHYSSQFLFLISLNCK